MKAVEQWRSGSNQEKPVKIVSTQALGTTTTGSVLASGKVLAEKLAQELELEQSRILQEFNDRLATAKKQQESWKYQTVESKQALDEKILLERELSRHMDDDVDMESNDLDHPHSHHFATKRNYCNDDDEEDDEEDDSSFPNDFHINQVQSYPDIQLIESKLGACEIVNESVYIVEEASDDE